MSPQDFTQCLRTQGALDIEAVDVAFIQPLKDLDAWWQRQSETTRRYVNHITALGGAVLTALVTRVTGASAALMQESGGVLLGCVAVGVALGVALDIVGRCGIQEIDAAL